MDRFHVASLTLKIIAIYIIIVLLSNIPAYLWILDTGSFEADSGISQMRHRVLILFPLVLLLLVSGALFALNRTFSWLLIDNDDSDPIEESDEFTVKQAVAFSVVGLIIFAGAVPGFLSALLSVLLAGGRIRASIFSEKWPELLSGLLQSGLGIALFFGARALSDMWQRFTSSTRPIARNDASDE
jgi:hypothetical protein